MYDESFVIKEDIASLGLTFGGTMDWRNNLEQYFVPIAAIMNGLWWWRQWWWWWWWWRRRWWCMCVFRRYWYNYITRLHIAHFEFLSEPSMVCITYRKVHRNVCSFVTFHYVQCLCGLLSRDLELDFLVLVMLPYLVFPTHHNRHHWSAGAWMTSLVFYVHLQSFLSELVIVYLGPCFSR